MAASAPHTFSDAVEVEKLNSSQQPTQVQEARVVCSTASNPAINRNMQCHHNEDFVNMANKISIVITMKFCEQANRRILPNTGQMVSIPKAQKKSGQHSKSTKKFLIVSQTVRLREKHVHHKYVCHFTMLRETVSAGR
jgi:hypothetical protein